METIVIIGKVGILVAWCLLPTFFWFRGVWRNDTGDRIAGVIVNLALGVVLGICVDLCTGINWAGAWFFVVGILSLIVAPFAKRITFHEVFQSSVAMIVSGILMGLVM